jgi:predicted dehydrogenase
VNLNPPINRKLRMGLAGGGPGAFIGRVHVMAAQLDGRAELVAGAFSSDPSRSRAAAVDYDIQPERAYESFDQLVQAEAGRPPSERVDFVSIATPNHTHYQFASALAEAGFHIICDKPLTSDLAQAQKLLSIVKDRGIVFGLTYNYSGYPLVRQARDMVRGGEVGEVQALRVHYIQGWLRTRLELEGQKQALWRTNPAQAGLAGCFGDIGTHAFHLAEFITGLEPGELSCRLETFERGRPLDDYGVALLRYRSGALGTLTASQISHGRENDLWIEIDGTLASLAWHQEDPNRLLFRANNRPLQVYSRNPGAQYTSPSARASCRLPGGHPEGFIEAFGNVYAAIFDHLAIRQSGSKDPLPPANYPTIADGVRGMMFVSNCVASSRANGQWIPCSGNS